MYVRYVRLWGLIWTLSLAHMPLCVNSIHAHTYTQIHAHTHLGGGLDPVLPHELLRRHP
jgi:hypothetical protein